MSMGPWARGPGPVGPLWSCLFSKNADLSTHMYIEDVIGDEFGGKNIHLGDFLSRKCMFRRVWGDFPMSAETQKKCAEIPSNSPAELRRDLCSEVQW